MNGFVIRWRNSTLPSLTSTLQETQKLLVYSGTSSSSHPGHQSDNNMHTNKKDSDVSTVCAWSPEPLKLNSAFSKVARRSLPAAHPPEPSARTC